MTTIEITSLENNYPAIENCIRLLNSHQQEFNFKLLKLPEIENLKTINENITTTEVYEIITNVKQTLKGLHNYIVVIIDQRLDGKTYGNLFGSMQENNSKFTGIAISSTYGLDSLLQEIPIETYLIFELISFSVRFVVNEPMIHDEERFCVFHRKVNKNDIADIIRNGHISQKSRLKIETRLEEIQIQAFEKILQLICEISQSPSPKIVFSDYLNSIDQLNSINLFKDIEKKSANDLINNSKGVGSLIENSISNSMNLFLKGEFLDTVRVIAPIIEDITNKMLVKIGENPFSSAYPGLFKKIEKLVTENKIPTDLAKSIDITLSRNKVLHGEYSPSSNEYVLPLAMNCIVYLDKIVSIYKTM